MFSERLKALRKERKLSQAALSAQLGVTQQAVGKWETGRSTPDPATVARLAALLGTTTDVLLGVSPAPQDFGGPVGAYMESPVPVVGSVRAGYGALAFEEDYGKEFLDYIISCKVVGSVEEAIRHINHYSTGHSECIVTKDLNSADRFTAAVDSAAVYVNASTRFTDGGEFGLGAEIGISTQKLHARGPMGLKELTTVKYVIRGNGQIR